MYFDFVYGILFDDRIPARQSLAQLSSSASHPTRHHTESTETRKSKICSAEVGRVPRPTRKSHRNTENKKNRLGWIHVVPSPVPHTESTETRKSKICSAEVVRVPRPTRKSTEFTKRGTGVGRSLRVHPLSFFAPGIKKMMKAILF